jgi:hypothetical protein
VNLKILAVIAGLAVLGIGALSIWIIVREGSPVAPVRVHEKHAPPAKPHKH